MVLNCGRNLLRDASLSDSLCEFFHSADTDHNKTIALRTHYDHSAITAVHTVYIIAVITTGIPHQTKRHNHLTTLRNWKRSSIAVSTGTTIRRIAVRETGVIMGDQLRAPLNPSIR